MTPPQPITPREVIDDDIREELSFDAEDHPDASAHVFATQSTDKKSGKCSRQPDTSSSDPAPKCAHTSTSSPSSSKHCLNVNCGRNGHEISDCFTMMGHISVKGLHSAADGIYFDNSSFPSCTVCARANIKHSPFPSKSSHRATEILQRIHCDVCGPLPPCFGSYQY